MDGWCDPWAILQERAEEQQEQPLPQFLRLQELTFLEGLLASRSLCLPSLLSDGFTYG